MVCGSNDMDRYLDKSVCSVKDCGVKTLVWNIRTPTRKIKKKRNAMVVHVYAPEDPVPAECQPAPAPAPAAPVPAPAPAEPAPAPAPAPADDGG